MLIKEFRVVLPMTVEEYQIAQLYSVAQASKNETGGGEGIEVCINEKFDENNGVQPTSPLLDGNYTSGQYTHKIYHLASKVPKWVRKIAPKGSLTMQEKAWNSYPYCRTILTNDYMDKNFIIKIESLHLGDTGQMENAHNLPADILAKRQVVLIDIANDKIKSSDYKPDEDPIKFKSEKTGRGPLVGSWMHNVNPVMCCYKLVTVEFKWWGIQGRIEKFIQSTERRLFTNFHRAVFCWTDLWYGLSIQDIRDIEERTKYELDEQIKTADVRGTKGADDDE